MEREGHKKVRKSDDGDENRRAELYITNITLTVYLCINFEKCFIFFQLIISKYFSSLFVIKINA